jgi:DNA-binding transcriptional MerR regulator
MDVLSTVQLAQALGLHRYQIEYLIENGVIPDTPVKVAGRRVWTPHQVDDIRRILADRSKVAPTV